MEATQRDPTLTNRQKLFRIRKIRTTRSEREKEDLQASIQAQQDKDMRRSMAALGITYDEDQIEQFQLLRTRKTRLPRNKAQIWDGEKFITVSIPEESEGERSDLD